MVKRLTLTSCTTGLWLAKKANILHTIKSRHYIYRINEAYTNSVARKLRPKLFRIFCSEKRRRAARIRIPRADKKRKKNHVLVSLHTVKPKKRRESSHTIQPSPTDLVAMAT